MINKINGATKIMLKYNRLNVLKLCDEYNTHYLYGDILRQTTIERIVQNNSNKSKSELIELILNNAKFLLEKSIKTLDK